eukprot:Nk52_evm19s2402 gene=Nk52_evmTU19s2402
MFGISFSRPCPPFLFLFFPFLLLFLSFSLHVYADPFINPSNELPSSFFVNFIGDSQATSPRESEYRLEQRTIQYLHQYLNSKGISDISRAATNITSHLDPGNAQHVDAVRKFIFDKNPTLYDNVFMINDYSFLQDAYPFLKQLVAMIIAGENREEDPTSPRSSKDKVTYEKFIGSSNIVKLAAAEMTDLASKYILCDFTYAPSQSSLLTLDLEWEQVRFADGTLPLFIKALVPGQKASSKKDTRLNKNVRYVGEKSLLHFGIPLVAANTTAGTSTGSGGYIFYTDADDFDPNLGSQLLPIGKGKNPTKAYTYGYDLPQRAQRRILVQKEIYDPRMRETQLYTNDPRVRYAFFHVERAGGTFQNITVIITLVGWQLFLTTNPNMYAEVEMQSRTSSASNAVMNSPVIKVDMSGYEEYHFTYAPPKQTAKTQKTSRGYFDRAKIRQFAEEKLASLQENWSQSSRSSGFMESGGNATFVKYVSAHSQGRSGYFDVNQTRLQAPLSRTLELVPIGVATQKRGRKTVTLTGKTLNGRGEEPGGLGSLDKFAYDFTRRMYPQAGVLWGGLMREMKYRSYVVYGNVGVTVKGLQCSMDPMMAMNDTSTDAGATRLQWEQAERVLLPLWKNYQNITKRHIEEQNKAEKEQKNKVAEGAERVIKNSIIELYNEIKSGDVNASAMHKTSLIKGTTKPSFKRDVPQVE